jgi:hypothetical protein
VKDVFTFITLLILIQVVDKMRRNIIAGFVLAVSLLTYSCADLGSNSGNEVADTNGKIRQKDDGTLNLEIKKASCYNDNKNPSCNTAEWNIVVSKPGRYKVWISSATIDTMHLQYKNSVKISLQDERLEVQPVGDKIVLDASDVKYPYFRADSYMGTFYISEAGEYSIQVISEKAIAQTETDQSTSITDHTKLMSVFLTPMTR